LGRISGLAGGNWIDLIQRENDKSFIIIILRNVRLDQVDPSALPAGSGFTIGKAMKPEFLLLAGWLSIQALGARRRPHGGSDPGAGANQHRPVRSLASRFHLRRDDRRAADRARRDGARRVGESHFTSAEGQREDEFHGIARVCDHQRRAGREGTETGRRLPVRGAFSSLLDGTFSTRAALFHDYQIAGREKCNNRPALVIKFATKRGQSGLRAEWGGRTMVQRDRGTAWIDEETLQVLRIERRFMNLPRGGWGWWRG